MSLAFIEKKRQRDAEEEAAFRSIYDQPLSSSGENPRTDDQQTTNRSQTNKDRNQVRSDTNTRKHNRSCSYGANRKHQRKAIPNGRDPTI